MSSSSSPSKCIDSLPVWQMTHPMLRGFFVVCFFSFCWACGCSESSALWPTTTDDVASVLVFDIAKLIAKARARSDRNMILTLLIFFVCIMSYSQYRNFTFTNVEKSVGTLAPHPIGMPSQFNEYMSGNQGPRLSLDGPAVRMMFSLNSGR